MPDLITAYYRFAEPGELTDGRVAAILPGPEPNTVIVIIKRGHATQELLDEMGREQTAMFETGQWYRLPDTPENRAHPRRVLRAGWKHDTQGILNARLCLSAEGVNEHNWIVPEGHATFRLVADMTWLLTRMVRSEVWIQRGAGGSGQ